MEDDPSFHSVGKVDRISSDFHSFLLPHLIYFTIIIMLGCQCSFNCLFLYGHPDFTDVYKMEQLCWCQSSHRLESQTITSNDWSGEDDRFQFACVVSIRFRFESINSSNGSRRDDILGVEIGEAEKTIFSIESPLEWTTRLWTGEGETEKPRRRSS